MSPSSPATAVKAAGRPLKNPLRVAGLHPVPRDSVRACHGGALPGRSPLPGRAQVQLILHHLPQSGRDRGPVPAFPLAALRR